MLRYLTLTSSRARALSLSLTVLLAAAPFAHASAQRETTDCLSIVDEMLSDSPAPETIRDAAECPASGPVTLASRWTRRGWRDDLERAALVEASSSLRDGRLYDAVLHVAHSRAYQREDRMAALQVLAAYYDPRYSSMGTASRSDRAILVALRTPVHQLDGSILPRPTYRREIREELMRMGDRDRDQSVRDEARRVAHTLALMEAADTAPIVQAGRPRLKPSDKPMQ